MQPQIYREGGTPGRLKDLLMPPEMFLLTALLTSNACLFYFVFFFFFIFILFVYFLHVCFISPHTNQFSNSRHQLGILQFSTGVRRGRTDEEFKTAPLQIPISPRLQPVLLYFLIKKIFYLFIFGLAEHANQDLNLCPLQWKCSILTTGTLRSSLPPVLLND